MQRITSEPKSGRMAQGRDTARHILGLGQAAIGISLASNFHDLLVAGNLPQRVGVGNASQDCIGGNPRSQTFARMKAVSDPPSWSSSSSGETLSFAAGRDCSDYDARRNPAIRGHHLRLKA